MMSHKQFETPFLILKILEVVKIVSIVCKKKIHENINSKTPSIIPKVPSGHESRAP